jgi:hypothetical protein
MGAHELHNIAQELMPFWESFLRKNGRAMVREEDLKVLEDIRSGALMIIRPEDYVPMQEAKIAALQRKYLRLKALTIKQVIDAQLLPQANGKTTIARWIKEGTKFKKGEVYEAANGTRMILVSAIKRLNPTL